MTYPITHFELRLELLREYFIAVNHQNSVVQDHYLSLILSGLSPAQSQALNNRLILLTEQLNHSFIIHTPSTINLHELFSHALPKPGWNIKAARTLLMRSLFSSLIAGELTFMATIFALMLSNLNLHLLGISSVFTLAGIISGINGIFAGIISVAYQFFINGKQRANIEKQIEIIREIQIEKFDSHNDIHIALYKALAPRKSECALLE